MRKMGNKIVLVRNEIFIPVILIDITNDFYLFYKECKDFSDYCNLCDVSGCNECLSDLFRDGLAC